jgi:hypothetical protein
METKQQNQLFVELNAEESATVNGAYHYYPCYSYPVSYYEPSYGYGYGYGYGSAQSNSVTQTTNVNVVYND